MEPQHDDRGGAAGARHHLLRRPAGRLPLGISADAYRSLSVRRLISSSSWSSGAIGDAQRAAAAPRLQPTGRPSRPDRSRSSASVLASRGLGLPGLIVCRSLRTSASVCRTLSPRATTCRASGAGSRAPSSARACPADSSPPLEHGADRRGQTEQADQIGDVAAALAQRAAPAPPGCGRTPRSGAGSRPPPRAASGPAAARSRAARPPAPRGRTARRRPPAARGSRRSARRASAARPATIS